MSRLRDEIKRLDAEANKLREAGLRVAPDRGWTRAAAHWNTCPTCRQADLAGDVARLCATGQRLRDRWRAAERRAEKSAERQATDGDATVGYFLALLSGHLTQWDVQQQRRDAKRGSPPNLYALGHFMGAVGRVRDAVDESEPMTADAAARFRAAVAAHLEPGFAPVRRVMRKLDDFLRTGKRPSYVAGAMRED